MLGALQDTASMTHTSQNLPITSKQVPNVSQHTQKLMLQVFRATENETKTKLIHLLQVMQDTTDQ